MSSSLSESEKKQAMADLRKVRLKAAKDEIKNKLKFEFVPRIVAAPGINYAVDQALGINRRPLFIEALRETADEMESAFDLMESGGNILNKGDKTDVNA